MKNPLGMALAAVTAASLASWMAACSGTQSSQSADPFEDFRGDPGVARTAVGTWVKKGEAAIPTLKLGLQQDSHKVKRYCTEALAKITGQWGWDDGLLWQRDVAAAGKLGKPLMVLHLFGNFDEEFC